MSGHRYLLDTNIVSDLVRNPHGVVARKVMRVGEDAVCTSIIVACELRYGAAKKNSRPLFDNVQRVLSALPVLPLESGVELPYGNVRTRLEQRGKPIGFNDLLIAAHALALDLVLVTANLKEFSRVPDLQVENWLA